MTPRRPQRPVAAAALAALWLLLIAPAAFAHAELATMTPADNSTVAAPAEVAATFTEALDPSGSNLVLVDAAGKVMAQDSTVVSDGEPKTMRLLLPDLAPGIYTVRWTSKSAEDGDIARGTTTFAVAAASASASVAPSVGSSPSTEPTTSVAPSVLPSPSPSGGTATPAGSLSDAVIPVVVVLGVLALLGLWLMRGRSRRAG